MKNRLIAILLVALLVSSVFLFVACDNNDNPPATTPAATAAPTEPQTTEPQTTEPVEEPDPDTPGYLYKEVDGNVYITGYNGTEKDLVFPKYAGGKLVTGIAQLSFINRADIESVTIPGTYTETGLHAFFGCKNLKKVTVQEGAKTVSRGTFNECSALAEISLPSTLVYIEDVAFQGAHALRSVQLPESLYSLGFRAFANTGLESVVVPENCTNLKGGVFAGCYSLKKAVVLANLKGVPRELFKECLVLEEVTLPMSVDTLGEYCFYRCEQLKELDAGNTNYLSQYALWGCFNLEKLYLHTTKMDRVCQRSLAFVPKLANIYYAGTMESWTGMRKIDDWNESLSNITINADWAF